MFINDYYTVNSEKEAQNLTEDLRANGYKRIANCFWYEIWQKGEHEVTVERDF